MDRSNSLKLLAILTLLTFLLSTFTFNIARASEGESRMFYGAITIIPSPFEGLRSVATPSKIFNVVSIGNASIDPCLWGLQKYISLHNLSGQSVMEIKNHVLQVKTILDLDGLDLPKWQVIAYNEIIYGIKPWGMPPYHHVPTHPFRLPSKVGLLPRIILLTNYTISKFNTGIDFSYDLWFKRENRTNGVWPGDAELMIWLYRHDVNPAGNKIGEISSKVIINGTIKSVSWEVWLYKRMGTGWLYIALVLKKPVREGTVGIDLTELIEKIKPLFKKYLGTNVENMYLMSIELGTEIFYSKHIDVEWVLSKYIITAYNKNISSLAALSDTLQRFTINSSSSIRETGGLPENTKYTSYNQFTSETSASPGETTSRTVKGVHEQDHSLAVAISLIVSAIIVFMYVITRK